MMLVKRVRAELMGMCFRSTRIQLLCEHVFFMLFNRVRAELMGMHLKSTGIHLCCEHVLYDALHTGSNITHGDAF